MCILLGILGSKDAILLYVVISIYIYQYIYIYDIYIFFVLKDNISIDFKKL